MSPFTNVVNTSFSNKTEDTLTKSGYESTKKAIAICEEDILIFLQMAIVSFYVFNYFLGGRLRISLASSGVAISLPSSFAISTAFATICPLLSARTPFSI